MLQNYLPHEFTTAIVFERVTCWVVKFESITYFWSFKERESEGRVITWEKIKKEKEYRNRVALGEREKKK